QWLDYWKPDGPERLVRSIRKEIGDVSGKVVDFTAVLKRKRGETTRASGSPRKKRATNFIAIEGDVLGGIVANNINLPSTKSPRMNYPAGSVGANIHKYNYLAYLISRYFEFRKADLNYGAM